MARISGQLLLVMGGMMVLSLAVSLYLHDGAAVALAMALGVIVAAGLLLCVVLGRKSTFEMYGRDSFWLTSIVWMLVPAAGALPYFFYGLGGGPADALFESVSGFTTTGSSITTLPELLPKGLLLWRSTTQWIGGLGLILFVVALNRRLASGSIQLYDAEFSGTQQRKLHPHIAVSVSRMWHIYTLLTIILIVALKFCGNGTFDSVTIALSTVSTGGFVTHSVGFANANSATFAVLTVFMFLSGVNVALLYNFFTFRWRHLKHSEEFVAYFVIFVVAIAVSVTSFLAENNLLKESVRYSLFHVASTLSTCGFYIDRPPHWSFPVSVLTFLLMFVGAMAGSTGGGLKIRRLMTLVRYLRNYMTRMIHPNVVFSIKIDRKTVPAEYVNKIFAFVFLYICFVTGGGFILTLCGSSIPEALSMAAANMANLGPSPLMDAAGSMPVYASLPIVSKCTLMVLMLAGRLEIFALLALVSPAYSLFKRQ